MTDTTALPDEMAKPWEMWKHVSQQFGVGIKLLVARAQCKDSAILYQFKLKITKDQGGDSEMHPKDFLRDRGRKMCLYIPYWIAKIYPGSFSKCFLKVQHI